MSAKYTARLNMPDTLFQDENKSIVFEIKKQTKILNFGFQKATIFNSDNSILLEFEYKNPFFKNSEFRIINHTFKEEILLNIDRNIIKLKVNNDEIFIEQKPKLFGLFEGKFFLNNQEMGTIKQEYKFFEMSTYHFNFEGKTRINLFCLLLFGIYSINFYDGD